MADTGTAIEKAGEGALDRARNAAPTEIITPDQAAIVRDTYARRADLAGRILSLLSNLGNLALKIMEQRTDSSSEMVAGVSTDASPSVASGPTRLGSDRQERRPARGQRAGGHRRQRRRGGV